MLFVIKLIFLLVVLGVVVVLIDIVLFGLKGTKTK